MSASGLCARVVVEELIARGVREVVLAPGSRSAPLAYELYEADQIGLLRLHVRVDERTAGFLALGLSRGSGDPVAVVTTSGTAVANLHPSVLEASHSGIPLVVVTADRPGPLLDTGANQTTDQLRIFGRHVRADAQLATDADRGGGEAVPAWRFQLARVLVAATGIRSHDPGPVHLNVAFAEPLVTSGEVERATPWHTELVVDPISAVVAPTELAGGPQTVVVAGDADPATGAAAVAFAEAARLPLLAEPSSNARGSELALGTYRVLLRSDLVEEIERVVVFGHPTLSRPVQWLLAREGVEVVMVTDRARWIDPGLNASRVTAAVTATPASDADEWLARWRDADVTARAALNEILARDPDVLTGPVLAAELWAALGPSDTLVVGSSNPIRDLDLVAHQSAVPRVFANRGLSGIDGTVSTAVGIALTQHTPTHALLGDLTLLHDASGLLIGPDEPRPPLRLVVANDDGGSIFATLEYGQPARMRAFERVFGTPHGTDLGALAAAYGVGHRRIERPGELPELLAEPPTGIEIIEARVDRQHRRAQAAAIAGIGATL